MSRWGTRVSRCVAPLAPRARAPVPYSMPPRLMEKARADCGVVGRGGGRCECCSPRRMPPRLMEKARADWGGGRGEGRRVNMQAANAGAKAAPACAQGATLCGLQGNKAAAPAAAAGPAKRAPARMTGTRWLPLPLRHPGDTPVPQPPRACTYDWNTLAALRSKLQLSTFALSWRSMRRCFAVMSAMPMCAPNWRRSNSLRW